MKFRKILNKLVSLEWAFHLEFAGSLIQHGALSSSWNTPRNSLIENFWTMKDEFISLFCLGSINWHQSIRSGLFAYETRQNIGCIQDGKTCGDIATESQDSSPVSGKCRLGGVEYPRPTISGRWRPSSSLLPMLHEQPAVQSAWKLLHPLRRKFHLFFHFFRSNYTFKDCDSQMLTFFWIFLFYRDPTFGGILYRGRHLSRRSPPIDKNWTPESN